MKIKKLRIIVKNLLQGSLYASVFIFFMLNLAWAQDKTREQEHIQRIQTLTGEMKALKGQGRMTRSAAQGDSEMAGLAKSRLDALEELVQTNPQAALDLSLPAGERSQFPQDVQKDLEQEVAQEGVLEVMIADDFENKISTTHHTLVDGTKRYPLHFTEDQPHLPSGAKVRVRGMKFKERIAVPKEERKGVPQ